MHKLTCEVIRADVPTQNGRTYSRECLERIVNQCNRRRVFVSDSLDGVTLPLTRVVGIASDFAIEDGKISAQVSLLSGSNNAGIIDNLSFSPMLCGTVDDDGMVRADDLRVAYFALTPKDEP